MYLRLFLLLVMMGGAWGWQHKGEVKRWWRGHMGGAVPAGVQVFTAAGCDLCEQAAVIIESGGQPVLRRSVDTDAEAREELEDSGGPLPLIVDGERRMNGFSEDFLRGWYVERSRNRDLLERAGVYRADTARMPVIYGTDWCGVCASARQYYRDHGIAFRDLDIERDAEAKRQYDMIGLPGVPVMVYEDMIWNGFGAESMDAMREWVGAR